MIGTIVSASVIEPSYNREGQTNGAFVELPDGAKGFLHVSRMQGKTREARTETLNGLVAGTPLDVEVVGETTIFGTPGFLVSQWGALKRKLSEHAEKLAADQAVTQATVVRLEPNFVIVDLQDGVQGLLHDSRVAGNSPEEKKARFRKITMGESIPVVVTEVRQAGRVRVSEFVA
jgi:ribosomal protein S1